MREPWRRTPDEIARLTDFQIDLMVAAQARQNERDRRAMQQPDGGAAAAGSPRLDREFAVAYLVEQFGHTRESAEAAVDRAAREGG